MATITVPDEDMGGLKKLIARFSFTPTASVYVLPAASPVLALPVSDTAVATLSELNPRFRSVEKGQTLQLITPDANVYVSISYYATLG